MSTSTLDLEKNKSKKIKKKKSNPLYNKEYLKKIFGSHYKELKKYYPAFPPSMLPPSPEDFDKINTNKRSYATWG